MRTTSNDLEMRASWSKKQYVLYSLTISEMLRAMAFWNGVFVGYDCVPDSDQASSSQHVPLGTIPSSGHEPWADNGYMETNNTCHIQQPIIQTYPKYVSLLNCRSDELPCS
jgi:hypothetical protein